ncbi:MAG: hypothetical protein LC731_02850, partial [Acidobacteria bacterium]|nr:hypothetical protein [Acidobacteriota bacterium]
MPLEKIFSAYTQQKFAQKAEQTREQFISELREVYMLRGLVLYVGAGVSKSIGLPTWPELIRALTVNMMSGKFDSVVDGLDKQSKEKSWETIWDLQEDLTRRTDGQKPILMMARAIKDALKDELPFRVAWSLYYYGESLRQYLWERYHNETALADASFRRGQLPSSPLMDAIVALARAERDVVGVRAIVNYNFDDLLEEKLREQNVRCRTVRSGSDPLPAGTLASYHVHGVLPMEDFIQDRLITEVDEKLRNVIGNFVFSEDEYHTEYSDPYRWSNM